MRKIYSKGLLAASILMTMLPLSTKAAETVSLQPNVPVTLNYPANFSAANKIAYPYKPTQDGQLVARIASLTSIWQGSPSYAWFTSDVSGYTSNNYDSLVEAAAKPQTYEKVWEGDKSENGLYDGPIQIWTVTEAKANQTYYLYVTYDIYSSVNFTIELLTNEGGGNVPTNPDDTTLESGVTTNLFKNQKGNFTAPANATGTSIEIKIVVNTTDELNDGGTILFEDDNTQVRIQNKTTEGGKTIYTFTDYLAWGPWYVKQTTLDEVEVTLSFPQYEETLATVELDKPFTAKADSKYQFTVDEAMIVTITSPVAMTEQQWNRVVYKDQTFDKAISTSSEFQKDNSSGSSDEGLSGSVPQTEANFKLTAAGTYYLKCANAGEYKITKYVAPEVKDPFETPITLVSPIEGVSEALNWVIAFQDQELDDSASLLSGATITNPDGKLVGIKKTYLTTAGETSTSEDALGLMIEYDDYDLCRVLGTYIIYLPEGIVYNKNGEPNPETTLNYNLKPTAVEGSPDYFEIDEMTVNVPDLLKDGYVTNEVDNLILTFPFDLSYYYAPENEDEDSVEAEEVETEITSIKVTVNGEVVTAKIENDNTIAVPIYEAATKENVAYTVRFENSLVQATIDDVVYVNPPMNVMFTLYAPVAEAKFDPENGFTFYANEVEKVVNVTWDGGMSFNNSDYSFDNSGITVKDSEGSNVELEYFDNVDSNPESTGIVFDFSKFEAGIYTINIPEASVLVMSIDESDFSGLTGTYSLNASAEATFIVSDEEDPSGITVIPSNANGEYEVYTLGGVKVATGKSTVVKNLPKGVYIINGKKVAL